MIDGFIFHKSYWDSISELPQESKCNIIQCMCEYVFNENELELKGIDKSIWTLMKPTLDSSIKRYKSSVENGKKGGRPKGSKTQSKPNNNPIKTQDIIQVKPNQNLNKDRDKDRDKDMDKDMDKDIVLSRLFEIFKSPDYAKNKIMKEWIVLDEFQRKYALEKAEHYLLWEKSKGNAFFNLMYYLKDRKWEWDLTIKNKKHNIPNEELPDHLKVWKV